MKREIKFRFWDGSLMQYDIDGWSDDVGINKMFTECQKEFGYTVMQFTGLKDKNGVEIYEGDILSCWDENSKSHTGVIENTPPCFSLKIKGKLIYDGGAVKQWENDIFLSEWCNAENIEVIGNIHANPELLTTP